MMRALACLLVACSAGRAPPPIENRAAPPATGCEGVAVTRVTARKDLPLALAGGKQLVFQGSSYDHFENGTAALMLQLSVGGESWLPASGDTAVHRVAGTCIRIVRLVESALELEIEATAVAPPARVDCQVQCCTTPESRQPAPDGMLECCMCTTD
ncbi:MAG: hypothetical protein WKG01_24215 [Kofleriaceae bacterium]